MKRLQKTVICFAAGLVLPAVAATNDAASTAKAYAAIATRNIFDLRPLASDSPVSTSVANPPPKITINGIMTIFGPGEVLFKVSVPVRPGHPAGENSYLLDEGQSQDEIEIRHIDLQAGVVTFNNHGVIQDISLADVPPVTASVITANVAPPVTAMDPARAAFERSRMPDYLGGGNEPRAKGETFQNKSLEQRILMIEAQRAYYKSQNDPRANDLPPTAMTPPDEPAADN